VSGHILVDFDGTLAIHGNHFGLERDPEPVPLMVERIKIWLMQGIEVRIFTARASSPKLIPDVEAWTLKHFGQKLMVTNQKDFGTIEIWDDRAVRVKFNEGKVDNEFHTHM
jgi:hypothetical protein